MKYTFYIKQSEIFLAVFYFGKENRKMELILLFVVYVIVMALKDARTPRGKSFNVGKYCQYVQKYGQEEADKAKKRGMFDIN